MPLDPNSFDYDEFLKLVREAEREYKPEWFISRLDDALAFQAWCADNGFEVPEVRNIYDGDHWEEGAGFAVPDPELAEEVQQAIHEDVAALIESESDDILDAEFISNS